jgi:hemerythrin
MAFIQWNDTYSVQVAELDQQHQRLIALINELHEAMQQGKGKDALHNTLDGLVSYTVVHFRAEEKYFEKFGYPETRSHKLEHTMFEKQIADFKQDFTAGKLGVSISVLNFLRDWLMNHIKGTDKKYSQFFNGKGLK